MILSLTTSTFTTNFYPTKLQCLILSGVRDITPQSSHLFPSLTLCLTYSIPLCMVSSGK